MHKNTLDKFGRSLKSKDFYEHKLILEASIKANLEQVLREMKDYHTKKLHADTTNIKNSHEKLQKELNDLKKEFRAHLESNVVSEKTKKYLQRELSNMAVILRWYLFTQILPQSSSIEKEITISQTSQDQGKTWDKSFPEYLEKLTRKPK